jgi:hypothetical protein
LIFPLLSRITRKQDYEATINSIYKVFPESDKQCRDESRFFFPSHLSDDGFVYEGELYKPTTAKNDLLRGSNDLLRGSNDLLRGSNDLLRGSNLKRIVIVDQDIESIVESIYGTDKRTIPENVDYFIRNAHSGLPNEWNTLSNAFIFTLAASGVSFETVEDIYISLAPEELDEKDEYLLNRAFNDGNLVYNESSKDKKW